MTKASTLRSKVKYLIFMPLQSIATVNLKLGSENGTAAMLGFQVPPRREKGSTISMPPKHTFAMKAWLFHCFKLDLQK
jgi:hypothetical protein